MLEPSAYDILLLTAAFNAAQLLTTVLFRRRLRRESARAPGPHPPSVTVVVACKGSSPDLADNISSLMDQDYAGRREYLLAFPSRQDPAHETLAALAAQRCDLRVRLCASEALPTRSSGKALDLVFALRHDPPDTDLLVFADADIRAHRGWLAALVEPLGDERVGASTSIMLAVPRRAGLWSWLRFVWLGVNASFWSFTGSVCGQSLAMRRKDFHDLEVPRLWDKALLEDMALTSRLRRWDKRVVFVAGAMPVSAADCDARQFFDSCDRWVKCYRIHDPGVWLLGAAYLLVKAGITLWTLLHGRWGLLALFWGLDMLNVFLLFSSYRRFLPDRFRGLPGSLRSFPMLAALASPLLAAVQVLNFAASILDDRVAWGENVYRVVRGKGIEVLDRRALRDPAPSALAMACMLSGAAYGLAHQPGPWGPLAWVSVAPLLWVCGRVGPAWAFAYAWLFGTAAWMVGSLWLTDTIARFLLLPRPAAALAFLAFCLVEGLQFALAAGLARWAAEGLRRRWGWTVPAALACAAPPFWVAVEWLFPEQFPKYLASTQLFHLPLVQSLELFGPAGLAWLIAGFNAALYAAVSDRRAWRALAALCLLVAADEAYGLARIRQVEGQVSRLLAQGDAVRVGVIQGSEPFRGRVKRHFFNSDLALHSSLTDQAVAAGPLDLVVWPETTFEGTVHCSGGPEGLKEPRLGGRPLQEALAPLLPQKTHLLLSALAEAPSPAGPRTYNVSILTGPSRDFLGMALKRHLIPFGEFLPLEDRLPILRRLSPNSWSLTPGRGQDILRLRDGTRLGILICYEDYLPAYCRAISRRGAQLLVHQAADAWFGGRLPDMHLRFGSLRAVENRRFMVRAVSSGISAVVDPIGRVTRYLGVDVRGTMTATVARLDGTTLYGRVGDVLYALAALLSLLLLLVPVVNFFNSFNFLHSAKVEKVNKVDHRHR